MSSDWDEIDWEDQSGLIAFRELKKRNTIRRKTEDDLKKVLDFTPEDWILVLLHLNGNSLNKTPLFKGLHIFGERTGLNDYGIFSWYPSDFGAYSDVVEGSLKDLVPDRLEHQIGNSVDGHVFKKYIIRDNEQAEKLCSLLPDSIKNVLLEMREEFKEKRATEIVNYAHDAYPEYATKCI